MADQINTFDRVLKILAREYAPRLLELALPDAPLRVTGTLENVELAIPEERVDFVHRIEYDEQEYAVHIEFQMQHKADVPRRLFVYSALLTQQLDLPVMTVVFYVARRRTPLPQAYEVKVGSTVINHFGYPVVKLWDYADEISEGKWPELAPLLIALVEGEPTETMLARERELILQEEDPRKRANLMACAVTIGARYFDKEFLWQFFREEVEMMREATFIEDWLEEKLEEGLQKGQEQGLQQGLQLGLRQAYLENLQRILHWRFGKVPAHLTKQLDELTATQLESLIDEALQAEDLEAFELVVESYLSPEETSNGD